MEVFAYEIELPSDNIIAFDGDTLRIEGAVKALISSKVFVGVPGRGNSLKLGYRIYLEAGDEQPIFENRATVHGNELVPDRLVPFHAILPDGLRRDASYTIVFDFLVEKEFWFSQRQVPPFTARFRIDTSDLFRVGDLPANLAKPVVPSKPYMDVVYPAPLPAFREQSVARHPSPSQQGQSFAPYSVEQQPLDALASATPPHLATTPQSLADDRSEGLGASLLEVSYRKADSALPKAFGDALQAVLDRFGAAITVELAYLHILGRRADLTSLGQRSLELTDGRVTTQQLATSMLRSEEYVKRDLIFHRDPRVLIASWAEIDAE